MEGGREAEFGRKLTASFLTPMTTGQTRPGNSINQDGMEPGAYTLQFSFVNIQGEIGGGNPGRIDTPTAQASIIWKVGGQQQKRIISISQGAAIQGVCNGVEVSITDFSAQSLSMPVGLTYAVQATLSRGDRGTSLQPPTLVNDFLGIVVQPGTFQSILVPQESGAISAYILVASNQVGAANQLAPNLVTAVFATNFGGFLSQHYPMVNASWVPLPPGTGEVIFFNNSAANPAGITVIWGIEG